MINPVGVEAARTPLDPIPDSPSPAAARQVTTVLTCNASDRGSF